MWWLSPICSTTETGVMSKRLQEHVMPWIRARTMLIPTKSLLCLPPVLRCIDTLAASSQRQPPIWHDFSSHSQLWMNPDSPAIYRGLASPSLTPELKCQMPPHARAPSRPAFLSCAPLPENAGRPRGLPPSASGCHRGRGFAPKARAKSFWCGRVLEGHQAPSRPRSTPRQQQICREADRRKIAIPACFEHWRILLGVRV